MAGRGPTRDPRVLAGERFDLVVIGAGLFGACAAWDAAQRGLSVALIERGDFGAATSAHSYKIVHGGIRYVQHGDVYRVRQSSNERRALLRIAPHLVRPLPIAIPTHGHGMGGRLALRAGLGMYDALTMDRNRGISDPARRIPRGHMLSRTRVTAMFGDLVRSDATGAGVFYDGQFLNPPRLVWSVVRSAIGEGAVAANYVEATGFLRRGNRVEGVVARDTLSDGTFDIRARTVLNAAGPYAETLLRSSELPPHEAHTYSRDACFVVPRRLVSGTHALAVLGQTRDPDARVSRGARHLFLTPWREYTLVGVWHRVQRPGSLDIGVSQEEVARFIAEVNQSAPGLDLTIDDVSLTNSGLVPFGENPEGAEDLRYGHRSALIDHARTNGCQGLVTLIGVRLTTARYEAQRATDLVCRKQDRTPPRCRTAFTPVHGGDISGWESLVRQVKTEIPAGLDDDVTHSIASHYGSTYRQLLAVHGENPLDRIADSATIRAQIYQAVRSEMAVTLADAVLRRTDMGTGAHPGSEALVECGTLMARELGWSEAELDRQVAGVAALYPQWNRPRGELAGARAARADTHVEERR